jgi:nucleotide-binding universal stress UspA family protein
MLAAPKVKRILFATDFLESSRLALDYAVVFAHHFKATIVMLHAVELSNPAREAELSTSRPCVTRDAALERIATIAASVRCTGLEVETFVEDDIPSDAILWAVENHSADLLVLGIHGVHRGLAHLLVGSNTERILCSATYPTMTVGAHVLAGVDPALHFKEIVYVSDCTPEATAAAPYAVFLGNEFQAPIDACHLIPEAVENIPGFRQDLAEQYCEAIRQVLPDAGQNWSEPSFHLDCGMEAGEIIDRAQNQNAGLIVLGVHTESHLGRHVYTSLAYQLLSKATCPVISIRQQSRLRKRLKTIARPCGERCRRQPIRGVRPASILSMVSNWIRYWNERKQRPPDLSFLVFARNPIWTGIFIQALPINC